jgi:hypothetical protein
LGEGRIHVAVSGLAFLLPQVQTGKAKLLMVTNHERAPLAPDVPTAQEAGYPDLTFDGVVGFYGWRDMPADLKQRIAADVRAVEPTRRSVRGLRAPDHWCASAAPLNSPQPSRNNAQKLQPFMTPWLNRRSER